MVLFDSWTFVFPARVGGSFCRLGKSNGRGVRGHRNGGWDQCRPVHPAAARPPRGVAHRRHCVGVGVILGAFPCFAGWALLGAVGYEEPSLAFATHGRVVIGVETPWQWVQDGPDRWLVDDGSLGALPENLVLERQLRGYCIPEGKWLDLRLIRPQ